MYLLGMGGEICRARRLEPAPSPGLLCWERRGSGLLVLSPTERSAARLLLCPSCRPMWSLVSFWC